MMCFNRFPVETNWCSYSYILYNVYQTKTNTASNLKRIKRKKRKKKNWKLSNPLACGAVDVKTKGSRDWGDTADAAGVPSRLIHPRGRQRTEGFRDQGRAGRGWRVDFGKVQEGQYRWRWDSPDSCRAPSLLAVYLFYFIF